MSPLKRHVYFISIIAILFVTGLFYANAFRGQGNLLVSAVNADEEDDQEDAEDEKDSDDEKEEDVKESDDDADKRDDEEERDDDEDKEDDNDERKIEYDRTEAANTASKRTSVGVRPIDSEEDEDEDEEDEEDGKDEVLEKVEEINRDLRKVEFKIGILSANGIQVAYFTPILAEVRSMIDQAVEKTSTSSAEAESILETAEHRLERLEKLVKVALDDGDDEEDDNDAAEKIQELAKDIVKIEAKLNLAAQEGVEIAAFRIALGEVKDLLGQAQEKMNAGDLSSAEVLAKMGEKKLENLENSLEVVFDDEDEEDDAERYKSEVAQFVHNLKNIAEIEGGIGQQVNVISQTQNDSALRVENAMSDVDSRNGFTEFLIGPKYKSIAEIENAIKENQVSIKVLSGMVAQIIDPAVKQVLQNQITLLNQQNINLQKFINQSESSFSMFGWLTRLFY